MDRSVELRRRRVETDRCSVTDKWLSRDAGMEGGEAGCALPIGHVYE